MSLSPLQQTGLKNRKKRARQAATDIATIATLYTQISDNDLDSGSTIYSFITKMREHLRLIENYQAQRIRDEQGMPRIPHMNSAKGTPKLEVPKKRKCPEPPAKKRISEMFPVSKDLPEEIEDSDDSDDNALFDETILHSPTRLDKYSRSLQKNMRKYIHDCVDDKKKVEKVFDEIDELETSSDKENDETLIDE